MIQFSRIAFFRLGCIAVLRFSQVIEKSLNAFYAIHMTRMSRKIAIHEIITNRLKLTCSIDASHLNQMNHNFAIHASRINRMNRKVYDSYDSQLFDSYASHMRVTFLKKCLITKIASFTFGAAPPT